MHYIFQKFPILRHLSPGQAVQGGAFFLAAGLTTLAWVQLKRREQEARLKELRPTRLVVLTGCDSGLGLSMAYWAGQKGYQVLAGCYNPQSEGAKFLEAQGQLLTISGIDVTDKNSLELFRLKCEDLLITGKGKTKLWALVPNAAVGFFGESFWQTEDQAKRIMDVNFWGSLNLTQAFHPHLLQHKSRVIVISSDCADYPLPGLSVYCASKAALETWATALRLEVAKYGVSVVSFQPGNFPKQTTLFSSQKGYYEEMKRNMSRSDASFYGNYFENYNSRIMNSFGKSESQSPLLPLDDSELRDSFLTLLEGDIRHTSMLTINPSFLKVFHFLLRNAPTRVGDALTQFLMRNPKWEEIKYEYHVDKRQINKTLN